MRFRHVSLSLFVTFNFFPLARGQQTSTLPRSAYKRWLREDVYWILSDSEPREFRQLVADDQGDRFIAHFWERLNPNPGSNENSFQQLHYRRLALSDKHFSAGIEGAKTDRGRIDVVIGPPDSISVPSQPGDPPEEDWFRHHVPRVGDNISVKFVDDCYCGAYELKAPLSLNRQP